MRITRSSFVPVILTVLLVTTLTPVFAQSGDADRPDSEGRFAEDLTSASGVASSATLSFSVREERATNGRLEILVFGPTGWTRIAEVPARPG